MAAATKTISSALTLLVLTLAWSASARKLLQSSSSASVCYVQLEQDVCVVAFSDVSGTQCQSESQQTGLTLESDGDNCFISLPLDCSDAIASFQQSTSYQVQSCGDSLTSEVQANSAAMVQAAGEICDSMQAYAVSVGMLRCPAVLCTSITAPLRATLLTINRRVDHLLCWHSPCDHRQSPRVGSKSMRLIYQFKSDRGVLLQRQMHRPHRDRPVQQVSFCCPADVTS